MNFSEALEWLKAGEQVYREAWNAEGIVVQLQQPDPHSKMINPYLYVDTTESTSKTKTRVPWLPSQTDILAEDWSMVETKGQG